MKNLIKNIAIILVLISILDIYSTQNSSNTTSTTNTTDSINSTNSNITNTINTTNITNTTNTNNPPVNNNTLNNNTEPLQPLTPVISNTETDPKKIYLCQEYPQNVTIGENITICIHFYERKYRMSYQITVDEYTVVSIGGAYNLASYDKSINRHSFLFQADKKFTDFPAIFLNSPSNETKNQFIIPVFNVVIKADQGKIIDVVWDNDCSSCYYEGCQTDTIKSLSNTTLFYESSNCKAALCQTDKDNVFNCDPKFYITWFGTDKEKKQMKSSNLSMSRFRQYSIGSLYSSARDVFNKTITSIVDTYNDVKTKTEEIIKGFKNN